MRRILAIIPARGGSKGLPQKNIRSFAGKPLIAHTIDVAKACAPISKVVVSTDCKETAAVALSYGADVPFLRPEYLATDESSVIDVINYNLDKLASLSERFDDVVLLQPTSPLRNSEHLGQAMSSYLNSPCLGSETLVSVYQAPVKNSWLLQPTETGYISFSFPVSTTNPRRQELPKLYLPNGAIYISPVVDGAINKFYGDRCRPFIMSEKLSVDIDTIEDFYIAERTYLGEV